VQPIKELLSAVVRCAGRGCTLIRQLANAPRSCYAEMSSVTWLTWLLPRHSRCSTVYIPLVSIQRCLCCRLHLSPAFHIPFSRSLLQISMGLHFQIPLGLHLQISLFSTSRYPWVLISRCSWVSISRYP